MNISRPLEPLVPRRHVAELAPARSLDQSSRSKIRVYLIQAYLNNPSRRLGISAPDKMEQHWAPPLGAPGIKSAEHCPPSGNGGEIRQRGLRPLETYEKTFLPRRYSLQGTIAQVMNVLGERKLQRR